MALKYKIGDKVRIKSIDWYNENKDKDDVVHCGDTVFDNYMSVFCGSVVTIGWVYPYNRYDIREDMHCRTWTDEMIEGLAEDDTIDIDEFQDDDETIDIIDEYVYRLKGNECQIDLPKGYQFTDEDGNVINTKRIILEKKQKEYPKTYEECCKIMDCAVHPYITANEPGITSYYEDDLNRKVLSLRKLLICRDAYWKIAGEEMGLEKPWEPSDSDYITGRYCIFVHRGNIICDTPVQDCIITFPTEEMRDAFKENFDKDLETCKELL